MALSSYLETKKDDNITKFFFSIILLFTIWLVENNNEESDW